MNLGNKNKMFILVFVIAIAAFFVARNDTQSILNVLYIKLLAPMEEKMTDAGSWSKNQKDKIANLTKSFEENKLLKQELADMRAKNLSAVEVWAENQRLAALLDYKKDNPKMALVTAKVIGRSPGKMRNEIIINRGTAQGIRENMPVVNKDGLVGTVTMVYDNSAKITLLSSAEASVGAIVQRPVSRAVGLVTGEPLEEYYLKLSKLGREMDVVVGDTIVTSGLSGLYPKGIFIGEVVDVVNEKDGLLKYAILRTRVDFDRLEEVMVLTNAAAVPDVTPAHILNPPVQKPAAGQAAQPAVTTQPAPTQPVQQAAPKTAAPKANPNTGTGATR